MRLLAAVLATGLILVILWEVFETIILPRRVQRRIRITRFFYIATWIPWRAAASRIANKKWRDSLLSFYGPASLLSLFAIWATCLVFSFALLHWGLYSPFAFPNGGHEGFWTDVYFSGVTFFTLGIGEVLPRSGSARTLMIIQAGTGMAYFAIVISYLPTLNAAFAQREVNISLLDARAGSPATAAELLRRQARYGELKNLNKLLEDWESWSAALMESHISYPVLCYFRSQHSNQSWVAALTAILDSCSVVITGLEGLPAWQARLTFAMCRHALVDIAQVFHRVPLTMSEDRLSPDSFAKMRNDLAEADIHISCGSDGCARLKELREMYEPYAYALSEFLLSPLPPWSKPSETKDNWATSAWKNLQ